MTQPTLTKRIESILAFIEDAAKQAKGFADEQSPDLIRQILSWAFWCNVMNIGICALLGLLLLTGQVAAWQMFVVGQDHYRADFPAAIILALFILDLPIVLISLSSLQEMVQVRVAPKVYLLEYAKSLIQKETSTE